MPHVNTVEIANFRGIAACKLSGLARVTVLIGRNNSGKTSVVEAVSRALEIPGVTSEVRGRSTADVWSEHRQEPSSAGHMIRKGTDTADVKLTGPNGLLSWRAMLRGDQLSYGPQTATPLIGAIGIFVPPDAMDRRIEGRLWERLLATRTDRELSQAMTQIFRETIETLQMLPNGDIIVTTPHLGIRLDGQGSGLRAALRLLMVGYASKGGMLFIEEPECHQHVDALKRLARALTTLATADTQVLLTTHSRECVRAFAECAAPAGNEPSFAAFSLERNVDATIKARRLSRETVLGLDDAGSDVRVLDEFQ